MTRLNLILFFVLIFTALGSVTAQHKSRKLYFELQQQDDAARQYDVEWGQLQLEQSTWAMHARIEDIATQKLHMQVPDSKRIQVVIPGSKPAVRASETPAGAVQPGAATIAPSKDTVSNNTKDAGIADATNAKSAAKGAVAKDNLAPADRVSPKPAKGKADSTQDAEQESLSQ